MPLILTLHNANRSGRPEIRTLEHGSLSIGRGPANDWVLQDPDLLLSKMHCMVAVVGQRTMLTDLSTNGVFVNGSSQRVERDGQVALHDGDEFALGGYVVRVSEVGALSPSAISGASGIALQNAGPTMPHDDPFGLDLPMSAPSVRVGAGRPDSGFGGRPIDPFGTPGGSDSYSGPPGMDPLRAPQAGGFAHLASKPVVPQRPFDPFAAIDEQRGTAPPVDPFMGKQPVDKWAGPSQRDNIDPGNMAYAPPKVIPAAPFGEVDFDALLGDTPLTPPPASSGPVAEFGQHGVMAKPAAPFNPQDFDIDDLLGDEPRGSSPATSAAASTPASAPLAATSPFGDDPGSPFHEPPRVPAEAPPLTAVDHAAQAVAVTVAETPIAAPTAPSADAALLLAAFLAGAGVPDLDLSKQNPEEYFKSMGALFRVMVESLRDVLMSRAEVKRGFGVEQTMLRARNNNALKFSPTAEDAVAALLQPDRKGYLPPLRATEEAFADLRSHQLAVMAGVQTALLGLLKRFDPAALETRLKKGSVIDTLLPSSRKARYWELFCETYKDIAGEAEDDFQAVFGKEFAKAYKEQEGKL